MTDIIKYTEADLRKGITTLVNLLTPEPQFDVVVGLSKGGVVPAIFLATALELPVYTVYPKPAEIVDLFHNLKRRGYFTALVIDEICDSGKTLFLFDKTWKSCIESNGAAHMDYSSAVLLSNTDQDLHTPIYSAHDFSRVEEPRWFEFFWEVPTN